MELINLSQSKELFAAIGNSMNAEIYLEGKLVDAFNDNGTVTVGEDNYPSPYLINCVQLPVDENTVFEYEPVDLDEDRYDDLRFEHLMDN